MTNITYKQTKITLPKIDYENVGKRRNTVMIHMELVYTDSLRNAETGIGLRLVGMVLCSKRTCKILDLSDILTYAHAAGNWSVGDLHLLHTLSQIQQRWNYNDGRAGTPEQEEFLRKFDPNNDKSLADKCKALEDHNLLEVIYHGKPYRYGSGCIIEQLDPDVLKQIHFIMDLNHYKQCKDEH